MCQQQQPVALFSYFGEERAVALTGRVEEGMGKGNKRIGGQAEGSKATAGRSAGGCRRMQRVGWRKCARGVQEID